jgi:hypothetical protein
VDPAIKGINSFQRLDVFLNKAADHGILVRAYHIVHLNRLID